MERFVLTDAQWAIRRSGKNSRLFVEAVLLIARTGSLWRDLPAAFAHWNSAYTRFRHCVKGGCLRSQRATLRFGYPQGRASFAT